MTVTTFTPIYGRIGPIPGSDYHVAIGHFPSAADLAPSGWDEGAWDQDEWDGIGASRLSPRDVPEPLVDVTCQVVSVNIVEGRDLPLDRFRPGSCTVVFDDPDGTLSPWRHADDPAADDVVRIGMDLVVWCEVAGGEMRRFTGIVDSITDNFPDTVGSHTVTFQAVDYLSIFAAFTPDAALTVPVGNGELAGARLRRIMTNAGYREEVALDDGTIALQATTLVKNALEEMGVTADTETGALYCDRWGAIIFRDRFSLVTDPMFTEVQAVFGDSDESGDEVCYTDITLVSDASKIKNVVTIGNVGGDPETVTDDVSVGLFRPRTFSNTQLVHQDPAQSIQIAQRQLDDFAYAINRIEGLTVDMATITEDQRILMVALDLLWRIEVRRRAPGFPIIAELQIQGMTEKVDAKSWTVSFKTFAALATTVANVWDLAIWDVSTWQDAPPPPPHAAVWQLGPSPHDKLDDGNVFGPNVDAAVWTMGPDDDDELDGNNVMGPLPPMEDS